MEESMSVEETYIINPEGSIYNGIDKWKEDYIKKDNGFNYDVYNDPDSSCKLFYKHLSTFLNIQEKDIQEKHMNYSYSFSEDPYGIKVKLDDRIKFYLKYLKSDQLGFSAPSKDKNHPYDLYLEQCDRSNTALNNVAEWIYYTRGLGGSFLWAMEKKPNGDFNQNPTINWQRGGLNKQQDRVDLTLDIIKSKCFTTLNDNIKYPNNTKWIGRFDFEEFVRFFIFYPFVVKQEKGLFPIDIIRNKIEKEDDNTLLIKNNDIKVIYGEKEIDGEEVMDGDLSERRNEFKKLCKNCLKTMLDNVCFLIRARSQMMEMVIEKKGNPWKEGNIPQWIKVEEEKWIFKITD